MNDIVSEYFAHLSSDTRSRMKKHYEAEKDEFVRLTSSIIDMLIRFQAANDKHDKDSPYHAAYGLMTKGANTLGAAFELTINGYLWEPPALLRVALETFCVAWDIVHNPYRFQKWQSSKKFDSTFSISKVKEVSAVIGQLNGLLSKINVHISPLNSSPAMIQGESPKIQLFGLVNPGKENIRRPEIYLSLFVTYICLQLAELTFYRYSKTLETIEMLEGETKARVRVSETHRKFIDEMESVFRQLSEGVTQ